MADSPRGSAARPWQRPMRWLVWLLDEALDRVPAVSIRERHIYLAGGWGCRLRLHRVWTPEACDDERP